LETHFFRFAIGAHLMTVWAAEGASRASVTAVADPVRTVNTDIANGAVCIVACTFRTLAAVVTDPVGTANAFFTAFRAYRIACIVATAALFVTFAVILKAVAAIVAQLIILLTSATISAVVLFIARRT